MEKYRVVIKNDVGITMYNELVEAKDEKQAIIKVLETEIIYAGDTISVDY